MSKEYNKMERLLEAWNPPSQAGDPVGCIATTFTFDAGFFEEDCLSAFLQMESDPDSEALAYILEREEKLSKVSCAMVLVDQHHARSNRNVRWDLLPVRITPGIQHAKISLLCWNNLTRIIIGSANLTSDGYRRNQEIFGIVDFYNQAEAPLEVIKGTLDYLEYIFDNGIKGSVEIAQRGRALIDRNRKLINEWNIENSNIQGSGVYPVFVRPDGDSVFDQTENLWDDNFKFRPSSTEVISPFFDQEYHRKGPLHHLIGSKFWNNDSVNMYCSGEPDSADGKKFRLHAPSYLEDQSQKGFTFYLLPEIVDPEKTYRPLHMKSIRLSRRNHVAMMLGSSNFTSSGTGTIGQCNYEANLLFLAKGNVDAEKFKILSQCFPNGLKMRSDQISFEPVPTEDDKSEAMEPILPQFIVSAEADMDEHKVVIRFTFDRAVDVVDFFIQTIDGKVLIDIRKFKETAHDTVQLTWYDPNDPDSKHKALPSGFDVKIEGADKKAWLPLNVRNYDCLPPPDQLRDLPLHVLLQILTSARPIHQILKRFFRELQSDEDGEVAVDPLIDPHKRVDTSGFILQRTRRISYAFNSIRENLAKPCGTVQSLNWKLYGPVGLQAVVHAILSDEESNQFKIPEERLFFLAELVLELSKIQPVSAKNCLPPEKVSLEFKIFSKNIVKLIKSDRAFKSSWLSDYLNRVMQVANTSESLA